MSLQKKCLITIKDKNIKIMVETDITEMGWRDMWPHIKDLIARHCLLGMKLESIVFYDDEQKFI